MSEITKMENKTQRNTRLLLKNYRMLCWSARTDLLELIDCSCADEIHTIVDRVRDLVDIHEDIKITRRLESLARTNALISLLESAVESLKEMPGYADVYDVIYDSYLLKLGDGCAIRSNADRVCCMRNISKATYYRLHNLGIRAIAMQLWGMDIQICNALKGMLNMLGMG